MIKLLLLGSLSDWADQAQTSLECNELNDTPAKIRANLQEQIPQMKDHLQPPFVLLAINQQVQTDWDMSLNDGDEVAFMPPFTGG